MQTELIRELNKVLKSFPKFWNGEVLHRTMVSEAISQKQPELIKALVTNQKIRSVYGTDIDGIFIFDFDKLSSLLKYKEYWANSFTKYRNKVGLTSGGKYIDHDSDVVLDFPFKDCVLEGGMTKEEQGKDEVYYNEIIAMDEIDNLFSQKILTHAKAYSTNGVAVDINSINEEDNIIIKGNNLIALQSMKERYKGKVKLICIDPPYNTTNDSFRYNDNFSHSTWLSFMKNRIEAAKELLTPDGSIWIIIDEIEAHYLKVLCDQILGRDNFVCALSWRSADSSNQDAKRFSVDHNEILIYSKNADWVSNRLERTEDSNAHYSNPDNDPRGAWFSGNVSSPNPRKNLQYKIVTPSGNEISPPRNGWRWSEDRMKEMISRKEIIFLDNESRILRKTYLADQKGLAPSSIWDNYEETGHNRQAKYELRKLFPDLATTELFKTPKPERLIKRILEIATNKNDLVLDFFLGSATTSAVALKMERRFIGIEQMDYIKDVSVARLQRVIEGEQGGISKDVNWQGGGSFVYTELMELNTYFVHEIQKAQSNEELEKLFAVMKTEAHLNYQVALENVLSAEYEMDGIFRKVAFNELELHEQKQLLIEILDKNQLYVNVSDMNDSDLNISESDKAFTRSFYGME
ncbi:site-specific DNA-methyltransferase [Serratia ureilytica]|uniref:site-specific DNA-methyltransferase n=1 Tax=Serratia ureilytica TaxID=300181 RepID=UPI0018D8ECE0|nr:site-specific DNA-methyltransferase [Serratia ureilytica]MBH2945352.1 site-specific DNA-methyltransferase [Serratia ureilytica]